MLLCVWFWASQKTLGTGRDVRSSGPGMFATVVAHYVEINNWLREIEFNMYTCSLKLVSANTRVAIFFVIITLIVVFSTQG